MLQDFQQGFYSSTKIWNSRMPKLINIVLYSQRLFIYHWTEAKDYVHFCVHFQQHELRNLNNASSLFKNILFRLFDVWSLRLSLLDFPTRGNWKLNVSLLQLILNWGDRVVKTTRKCFSLVPKQPLLNVKVSCILIKNREAPFANLTHNLVSDTRVDLQKQNWVIYCPANSLHATVLSTKT